MKRQYYILDVFTDTALEGNPLAVVIDSEGLDGAQMQAIAREFNLAETVFVLPPRDPVNSARIEIFTPNRKLPFAGHPTVGTAILLAELNAPEVLMREDVALVFEEDIGAVPCTVWRRQDGITQAKFVLPKRAEKLDAAVPAREELALALNLPAEALEVPGFAPEIWSAGNPFCCIPVQSIAAIAAAKPNLAAWDNLMPASAYVFSFQALEAGHHVHTRMFAKDDGREDPATGSAVAAFSGYFLNYLKHHGLLKDGSYFYSFEQGYAMGRKSCIQLGLEIEAGAPVAVTIGGAAAFVAEGTLDL